MKAAVRERLEGGGVMRDDCQSNAFPLTCSGNAVKPYKGIKAGGGTGQDSSPAKRHEAALAKTFF